jgi:hypothetical protein
MTMKNLHRALAVAMIVCPGWGAWAADEDKPKGPLSEAALVKLAKSDIEDEVIVALVKKRGISFEADAAAVKRLRKAGVSDAVLAALKPADGDSGASEGADKPLGTGKFQKGLVIDVTEVKLTSDNYLKVSFRIRNPTNLSVTHTLSGAYFVPEMYYVDGAGKLKYQVVRDSRGNYVAAHVPGTLTLGPGEAAEYWAKFGKPQRGTERITMYFRQAEPIEDIPLAPGK